MNTHIRLAARLLATLPLAGVVAPAFTHAQVVITPAVQVQKSPSTSGGASAKELKGNSSITSALADGLPLWQRGPVSFRPHIRYRFIQANGVHATPVLSVDTSIQEIAPALIFEIGKHWILNYTPTWTIYSSEFFRNSLDQSVTLTGGGSHGPWTFGGSQSYTAANTTLVETGGQTHQKMINTGASAGYQLGRHAKIQVDLNRGDRRVDAVDADPQWTTANWLQWSGTGWLIYEFTPKLMVGAGATLGYDQISRGPDMDYMRPQAQVTWQAGEKLSVHLQAGVEKRHVKGGDDSSMSNPIYSGSIDYQALRTTKLSAGMSRSVTASYFANRATRGLGWNAGIQQRLLGKLYFAGEISEFRTKYLVTGGGTVDDVLPGRDDVSRSYSLKLSTPFLRRGTLALFYQLGRNTSDVHKYAFRSNQFGFEFDYQF
jgi:hypothetical protein